MNVPGKFDTKLLEIQKSSLVVKIFLRFLWHLNILIFVCGRRRSYVYGCSDSVCVLTLRKLLCTMN